MFFPIAAPGHKHLLTLHKTKDTRSFSVSSSKAEAQRERWRGRYECTIRQADDHTSQRDSSSPNTAVCTVMETAINTVAVAGRRPYTGSARHPQVQRRRVDQQRQWKSRRDSQSTVHIGSVVAAQATAFTGSRSRPVPWWRRCH